MGGRLLLALKGVIVAAAAGNEGDGGIARQVVGMGHPVRFRKLRHFGGKALSIEPKGQAYEGLA